MATKEEIAEDIRNYNNRLADIFPAIPEGADQIVADRLKITIDQARHARSGKTRNWEALEIYAELANKK